jgi:transcriptional regulator with XRE-family HTH domain
MELREYLAARRKSLGLTQSEIARAIGYSETAISKIESGDSFPPISVLPVLADCLDLSLNDLLSMKENPERFIGTNPPYDWRVVSANLRAARLGHHLKQHEAAKIIGVDKRTLITYEKGDACPNLKSLPAILTLCPGDPADLFYGILYPDIQASPLFRKRGTLPFFVFIFGLLLGAGILGGVLGPLVARSPSSSSSSDSKSGPFNNSSSEGSSSSSSSEDSSPSSSASSSSDSIDGLTELVVIGPTGTASNVPMLYPKVGETSTLQIGLYTNADFDGHTRRNLQYKFAFDGNQPAGVTMSRVNAAGETISGDTWAQVDYAVITATNSASAPFDTSFGLPSFIVFACARRSPTSENPDPLVSKEATPLLVEMTETGTY